MITPLDIENKKFSKQMMNGYNVDEVDDFLDEITVDYEKNYRELTELKDKVEKLEGELSHYKNLEGTLQNTLVMAQSTAEEVKNVAKQQAEQIIQDAKSTVQQNVDDLNSEIKAKQQQLDDVRQKFDVYKAKMESLLISQFEILKEMNKEE